jgi:hypothetical protein
VLKISLIYSWRYRKTGFAQGTPVAEHGSVVIPEDESPGRWQQALFVATLLRDVKHLIVNLHVTH